MQPNTTASHEIALFSVPTQVTGWVASLQSFGKATERLLAGLMSRLRIVTDAGTIRR